MHFFTLSPFKCTTLHLQKRKTRSQQIVIIMSGLRQYIKDIQSQICDVIQSYVASALDCCLYRNTALFKRHTHLLIGIAMSVTVP